MRDALDRFFSKVEKTDGCWLWTAGRRSGGYGGFWVDGRMVLAHRWLYERLVGPVPDGLVLDHYECDTPLCVNPAHLRPCTDEVNLKRSPAYTSNRTHCPQGHEYTSENTKVYRSSTRCYRYCVTCHREQGRINTRRYYARRRAQED